MRSFNHGRFVRGGALTLALGVVTLGGATWLGTRLWMTSSNNTGVTARELQSTLLGGGLSPTRLAAAGLTSGATATLVENAREHLDDNPGELAGAHTAVLAAQADVERLEKLVQQGQGSETDLSALTTARAALASAISNRNSKLSAFITAAESGLSEPQRTRLATIRGNASINLPVKYLVTTRTSAEWVALRDALTSCAARARSGEAADPASESLIADANAVTATSDAAQALTTNLATVTSAFNSAVGL